jgi:hypothetical protein
MLIDDMKKQVSNGAGKASAKATAKAGDGS